MVSSGSQRGVPVACASSTFPEGQFLLRSLRFWAGVVISAVLIGLFLRATHPRDIASALADASYWWLIPATFVLFGALSLRCYRWAFLMRPIAPISASRLFPYAIIGYMANNLLPARAGEIVRAWVVGEREQVSKVGALGSIAVERLFDGCVLVLMFLVAGAFVGLGDERLQAIAVVSSVVFVAAFAGFYVITATEERARRALGRFIPLLPDRYEHMAEEVVSNLARSLRSVHSPRALAAVAALSAAAWTVEAACYAVIGRAFGLDVGFGHYCLLLSAANLAIIIPTFFGGTGPFEWAAKLVLVSAGTPDAVAGAYSIIAHAVVIVPTTILGLLFLWSFGISFRRMATVTVNERGPVP